MKIPYSTAKKALLNIEGFSSDESSNKSFTPELMSGEHEKALNLKYSVYTPKDIVRKMIAISFGRKTKREMLKEKLKEIRVADISCGTGNFLVEVVDFLIRVSKIYSGQYLFCNEWIEGYDIDEKAIAIANIRLKLVLKKYGIKHKGIKFNLYRGDVLPEKIDKKYDLIIGNPPYLGEKNNKGIFDKIRESDFGKRYYEGRMDYFYFFIEKGIDILKEEGNLAYITTNYWLKADYASKLRQKVKEECSFVYANIIDESVFENNLGQDNFIFLLEKNGKNKTVTAEDENGFFKVPAEEIYGAGGKITITRPELTVFFKAIERKANRKLGDLVAVNQGIVSGYDEAFVFKEYIDEFGKYLKPFYKNKDIKRYKVNENNEFWILYLNKNIVPDERVLNHLEKYRERLANRREAKNGKIGWHDLQWGRDEEIFLSPKIVARQRGVRDLFGYTDKPYYGSADIYYLTPKRGETLFAKEVNLFYILGYLNSKTFYQWFFHRGKRKGKDLELYATPLKETPIYYPDSIEEIKYIEELVKSQINCYNDEVQEKIEEFFEVKI